MLCSSQRLKWSPPLWVQSPQVLEEERDLDDLEDLEDLEDSVDLGSRSPWGAGERAGPGAPVLLLGGGQATCHLLVPPLERSGRGTPASLDSIPLEWDHTVDVGGSSSHEDEEEATYFSALSGKGPHPNVGSGGRAGLDGNLKVAGSIPGSS